MVISVNEDMKKQNRKILLIIDSCPAHPEIPEMSNVKLKFLPPNTTSALQPMDQGIIKNVKVFYRKLLLRMVISKSVEGQSASVVAKSVTVLDAIQWIGEAWSSVKIETITNCFRKAGLALNDVDHAYETTQTTEEELKMKSRFQIDGVEYVLEDFVCCDNDFAITKVLDSHELRVAVLEDLDVKTDDEVDDEDLILLNELRSRIVGNNTHHSSEERMNLFNLTTPSEARINENIDEALPSNVTDLTKF